MPTLTGGFNIGKQQKAENKDSALLTKMEKKQEVEFKLNEKNRSLQDII